MSIKSGPWTMNQSHANEMIAMVPQIYKHRKEKCRMLIGITYGKVEQLNNKPGLVSQELNDPGWFDYMIGKDFWEYICGVKDAHRQIFAAIREGQRRFTMKHENMPFAEKILDAQLEITSSIGESLILLRREMIYGRPFSTMLFNKGGNIP